MTKKIFLAVFSLVLSGLLIMSIPLLNYLIHGGPEKKPKIAAAGVSVRKIDPDQNVKSPRKKLKKPVRKMPSRTRLETGPRFAMDLNVTGAGGVEVELDLAGKAGGRAGDDGDVDEKPSPDSPPPFQLPREVKEAEINAYAVLSFCVDAAGRPFEIRTVEERPAGKGMALAGREALRKTTFRPALKDGTPVPFCGLEQPFEVKFDD
jgi:protein TonB